MPTTVLRYIPEDPLHMPGAAAIETARAMLQDALDAPAVATVTESLTFVDPGENLDTIRCPACGDEVDMGFWHQQMTRAGAGGFADLTLSMPCCGVETSLHDLDYDMPAGFALLVLEVQEPKADPDDAVDVVSLGRVLGCMLRRIDARY